MADDLREGRFLDVDRLPEAAPQKTYTQLRQGQIYIQQLHTQPEFEAPGGLEGRGHQARPPRRSEVPA
jgi:hypothetical protein